jgi:uncharacterized protein (TIGR02246 family)
MDHHALEDQIRTHFAAWNRRDAPASIAMLAPDCVLSDNGRRLVGREAILTATRQYFDRYPDLRLEPISIYVASNAVLSEWRVHTSRYEELTGTPARYGHARPTGSRVDEFNEDMLVRRSTLYWDTGVMLRHFGIQPRQEATNGLAPCRSANGGTPRSYAAAAGFGSASPSPDPPRP